MAYVSVKDRLSAKESQPYGRRDLLSRFVEARDEDGDMYPLQDMVSWTISPLSAGSDSTAASLRVIVYHLCANPQILAKLRREIDIVTQEGKLSQPATFSETCQMPYLNACIKEAMRCNPPVGFPLQRVVPKGGKDIAGRFFPEATLVGVNPWVVHRNKRLPTPNDFW